MATYVPNAITTTEPVESRSVESAALEFRTLKTSVTSRVDALQVGLDTLQTEVALEVVNRTNADNAIVASISPYIDQVALANFPNNFDLGFISDPVASLNFFDFGSI
jgi:hypothetical protein